MVADGKTFVLVFYVLQTDYTVIHETQNEILGQKFCNLQWLLNITLLEIQVIKEKTNRIKHYSCIRLFITAAFSVIELVSALSTHTIFFLFLNRDYYFTAVSWVRSDAIAVIWMNRAQNISLVTECNQPTWICKKVSFVYHLSQFVFLLVFF